MQADRRHGERVRAAQGHHVLPQGLRGEVAITATRLATPEDAAAIAAIYNEGIEDRIATFETELRAAPDVLPWIEGEHPVVVVERDGEVAAFAAAFSYRDRDCYDGVAEFSVYVARRARGNRLGDLAMRALMNTCHDAGIWKLVSRVFPENTASLALLERLGFRVVGQYERHGQLDGVWKDTVIVERLL